MQQAPQIVCRLMRGRVAGSIETTYRTTHFNNTSTIVEYFALSEMLTWFSLFTKSGQSAVSGLYIGVYRANTEPQGEDS